MVNKDNILRKCLNEGKPTVSTRLWSPWAFYTEALAATQKYTYMEFVAEYAPFTQYDLENMARAAELYEMGSMIKADFQNRGYTVQKAICSGFQAVNWADHETAEQIKESLRMVKPKTPEDGGIYGYPNRRYIGCQPHLSQLDHAKRVREIVNCFMIEKHETVDEIEKIVEIPGVDMIQFGPSDFSLSLGYNKASYENECKAAELKCIKAALNAGVRPRCEIGSADDAKYYIDLGVKDFSIGDQFKVIRAFWEKEGEKIAQVLQDEKML